MLQLSAVCLDMERMSTPRPRYDEAISSLVRKFASSLIRGCCCPDRSGCRMFAQDGKTALTIAAEHGDLAIIECLTQHGGDVDSIDEVRTLCGVGF